MSTFSRSEEIEIFSRGQPSTSSYTVPEEFNFQKRIKLYVLNATPILITLFERVKSYSEELKMHR